MLVSVGEYGRTKEVRKAFDLTYHARHGSERTKAAFADARRAKTEAGQGTATRARQRLRGVPHRLARGRWRIAQSETAVDSRSPDCRTSRRNR